MKPEEYGFDSGDFSHSVMPPIITGGDDVAGDLWQFVVEAADRSISISEMKRFLNCRLKHRWASAPPRGRGLAPAVSVPELQLGRVIHQALQLLYDHPEVSAVKHYWDSVEDNTSSSQESSMFEDNLRKIEDQKDLGARMMEGYEKWSREVDKDYSFLATETQWDGIELPGTPATISGVFDAVVRDNQTGDLWVLDFKTTGSTRTGWTSQDLQATAYVYVARKMYGPQVKGIIFRFLLKKAPYDYHKLILKSGRVTKRQNLSHLTTYEEYYRALAVATLKDLVENKGYHYEGTRTLDAYNEALSEVSKSEEFKKAFAATRKLYWEQLQETKGARDHYFWDVKEHRTPIQVENYLNNLIVPTCNEIIKPHWVGPTGLSASWALCGRCPFKVPCKLAMDGGDYEEVLNREFALSDHYKEELEDEDEIS